MSKIDLHNADQFLEDCRYMTIAVVLSGNPWAVPVRIQKRDGFSFEWDSSTDALHSRAIEENPRVALSMFRPNGTEKREFGFYARAEAQKVADLADGRARYRAVAT